MADMLFLLFTAVLEHPSRMRQWDDFAKPAMRPVELRQYFKIFTAPDTQSTALVRSKIKLRFDRFNHKVPGCLPGLCIIIIVIVFPILHQAHRQHRSNKMVRSEERRVGKEGRCGWWRYQ